MKKRRILYIQYTNPACYPPLVHSAHIFADHGWNVLFFGKKCRAKADKRAIKPHKNIKIRQLNIFSSGFMNKIHYLWFFILSIIYTMMWRPRWIYLSEYLACPVGLLLTYMPGINIIYHEHDLPNLTEDDKKKPKGALWARNKLALRSRFCIFPNKTRAEIFKRETGRKKDIFCVLNCPTKDEVQSEKLQKDEKTLKLYYHGNISEQYLPTTILKAMKKIPYDIFFRINGFETPGSENYVENFKKIADEFDLLGKIEFSNLIPTRYELMKQCSSQDVGIAFIPKDSTINNQSKAGASNKAFDYLACGMAVLVSDLPDWKNMYIDAGYGLACDPNNENSIKLALEQFIENTKKMQNMGEAGRKRIEREWNYERQFEPILNLLENKFKSKGNSEC